MTPERLAVIREDITRYDGTPPAWKGAEEWWVDLVRECVAEIERLRASNERQASLLRELADKVRDWYGLRGVAMDDASVLRMCVQDVEASQAVYLRLEAPVVDLIRAVESVQDWDGTRVGKAIEAVESVLNYRY